MSRTKMYAHLSVRALVVAAVAVLAALAAHSSSAADHAQVVPPTSDATTSP
jgi:hypothetical protein